MKVAVVGCGTMGRMHAESVALIRDATLVGVYDQQQEAADQVAALYGAKRYASYEELLADGEVEVVNVTLPTFLHREYAVKALESGKHVVCEKPIALNEADASEMIETSKRCGRRLFIGQVLRFFPEYADIYKHVQSGRLGRIGVAHSRRSGSAPAAGSWFWNESLSGGVVLDLMIHDIDFMRWTLGEAKRVFATISEAPGIQYANVTIRFGNGAIANLEAQWGRPGTFVTEAEFAGSAGVVRSGNRHSRSLELVRSASAAGAAAGAAPGVTVPQSPLVRSPYQLQLEHFYRCIRTGEQPIVTAEDASRSLALALAAMESARAGKPIILNGGGRDA